MGNGEQTFLGFVFLGFSLIIKAYSTVVHAISLNTIPTPKTSGVIYDTHIHTYTPQQPIMASAGVVGREKKQQKLHRVASGDEQQCV